MSIPSSSSVSGSNHSDDTETEVPGLSSIVRADPSDERSQEAQPEEVPKFVPNRRDRRNQKNKKGKNSSVNAVNTGLNAHQKAHIIPPTVHRRSRINKGK